MSAWWRGKRDKDAPPPPGEPKGPPVSVPPAPAEVADASPAPAPSVAVEAPCALCKVPTAKGGLYSANGPLVCAACFREWITGGRPTVPVPSGLPDAHTSKARRHRTSAILGPALAGTVRRVRAKAERDTAAGATTPGRLLPCAGCGQPFMRNQLMDSRGRMVCPPCQSRGK